MQVQIYFYNLLLTNLTEKYYYQLMQPIDWYILATPFFMVLLLLTLIVLKMSLKAQPNISEVTMKKLITLGTPKTEEQQKTIVQKYSTLKTLKFLTQNHSFLEICFTRKSKNKLTILLSISGISALCVINPSIFINSIVGLPIVLIFIITQSCSQTEEPSLSIMDMQREELNVVKQTAKNQESISIKRQKYLFTIYSILGSALALLMCGLTFKNYSNLFLSNMLKNIVVNVLLDLCVIRPVGFAVLSFPLSFSKKILMHIQIQKLKQNYSISIELEKDEVKNCATKLSPKKQSNSPTKVPKAVIKLCVENSQNRALINAMQISKRIKKEKFGQTNLIVPMNKRNKIQNQRSILEQYSLNELFEEVENSKKSNGRQTPILSFHEEDGSQRVSKLKRKATDLVIVEFKVNEENDADVMQRRGSFLRSNLDLEEQNSGEKRKNLIRLFGNEDNREEQQDHQDFSRAKKQDNSIILTLEKHDQLHINNLESERQFQQIDINSPNKRTRQKEIEPDFTEFKLNRKGKTYKGNARRRTIKFTTGEPYLEYLPNMLTHEKDKHKKSQPINTIKPEIDLLEQRKRNGIKKTRTKKEKKFQYFGDENVNPGTLTLQIQDL